MSLDLGNIQSIIHRAPSLPYGRHLLFGFSSSASAKSFLRRVCPHLSCAHQSRNRMGLNLSLSFSGLAALGLDKRLLMRFPISFRDPDRLDLLNTRGDMNNNHPQYWWGKVFHSNQIHCVVHVFACNKQGLDETSEIIRRNAKECDLREYLPKLDRTGNSSIDTAWPYEDRREHFGFREGSSQTPIRWGEQQSGEDQINSDLEYDYRQFMLGFDKNENLSDELKNLFRFSTYGAFRLFEQDVCGFHHYLDEQAERVRQAISKTDVAYSHSSTQPLTQSHTHTHQELKEWVAAKMMGRWRDGTPTALSDGKPNRKGSHRPFGFIDDPNSQKCAINAHFHLVNPRRQLYLHEGILGNFSSSLPLIHRGAPYGPAWELGMNDTYSRGMAGLFLTGQLKGFEMIMNGFQTDQSTSEELGMGELHAQDRIVGNRINGSEDFSTTSKHRVILENMPQFIRTRGALNLLFPDMSAFAKILGTT